jgi:hypothetical protein
VDEAQFSLVIKRKSQKGEHRKDRKEKAKKKASIKRKGHYIINLEH